MPSLPECDIDVLANNRRMINKQKSLFKSSYVYERIEFIYLYIFTD